MKKIDIIDEYVLSEFNTLTGEAVTVDKFSGLIESEYSGGQIYGSFKRLVKSGKMLSGKRGRSKVYFLKEPELCVTEKISEISEDDEPEMKYDIGVDESDPETESKTQTLIVNTDTGECELGKNWPPWRDVTKTIKIIPKNRRGHKLLDEHGEIFEVTVQHGPMLLVNSIENTDKTGKIEECMPWTDWIVDVNNKYFKDNCPQYGSLPHVSIKKA